MTRSFIRSLLFLPAPLALMASSASPAAELPEAHSADSAPLDTAADAVVSGEDLGQGNASYYGRQFAGKHTASGETFDPTQLTAAHRTLPFGSLVRVTWVGNGRSVVVRINDRGPFSHGRVIDVSRAAAEELGMIGPGRGLVSLTLLPEGSTAS